MSDRISKIALCEEILDHKFSNREHCLEALQTSGDSNGRKNDELAIIGDIKAKLHLAEMWYETGRKKGTIPTQHFQTYVL